MGAQSRTQARTGGMPQSDESQLGHDLGLSTAVGVVCVVSLSLPHFPAFSRVGGYRTNRLPAAAVALPYSLSPLSLPLSLSVCVCQVITEGATSSANKNENARASGPLLSFSCSLDRFEKDPPRKRKESKNAVDAVFAAAAIRRWMRGSLIVSNQEGRGPLQYSPKLRIAGQQACRILTFETITDEVIRVGCLDPYYY